MSAHQIEVAAKVLAAYELFEWEILPERDARLVRDRAAFRQIASDMLNAAHGAP